MLTTPHKLERTINAEAPHLLYSDIHASVHNSPSVCVLKLRHHHNVISFPTKIRKPDLQIVDISSKPSMPLAKSKPTGQEATSEPTLGIVTSQEAVVLQ